MGAWGCGLYDNDIAMDCFGDYEDSLKNGMDKQSALQELIENWYINDNYSVLVLADLQAKNFGKIQDSIKTIVKRALEEEMEDVINWREPDERKNIIESFYKRVKELL
jgi:hypothetical protein